MRLLLLLLLLLLLHLLLLLLLHLLLLPLLLLLLLLLQLMEGSVVLHKYMGEPKEGAKRRGDNFLVDKLLKDIPNVSINLI